MEKSKEPAEISTSEISAVAEQAPDQPDISELIKSHLDEVAGGLASHGSWFAHP